MRFFIVTSRLSTKSEGEDKGVVLLLEPSPEFYAAQGEKINRKGFGFLIHYVKPHTRLIVQLAMQELKKIKEIEIHTEEVNDILSRPPT